MCHEPCPSLRLPCQIGWVQLKDEETGHPYYYNQVRDGTCYHRSFQRVLAPLCGVHSRRWLAKALRLCYAVSSRKTLKKNVSSHHVTIFRTFFSCVPRGLTRDGCKYKTSGSLVFSLPTQHQRCTNTMLSFLHAGIRGQQLGTPAGWFLQGDIQAKKGEQTRDLSQHPTKVAA